jgi:hypothetical protein
MEIQFSASVRVENEAVLDATLIDDARSFHPAPTRHELSAVTTKVAPLKLSFS